MRGKELSAFRTGTVGSSQPVGLISTHTEEAGIVDQSQLSGSRSLQLTEEDVGRSSRTSHEGTDATDKWSEERVGYSGEGNQTGSDSQRHTCIVHEGSQSHQAADGERCLLEVVRSLTQQLHQSSEAHALDKSTDYGTQEHHQAGIAQPSEGERIADDWHVELGYEGGFQQVVDIRTNLAGDEDEEDDEAIDTPCLEGLGQGEALFLHLHTIAGVLQEELVVDEHSYDGTKASEDSRCLRA